MKVHLKKIDGWQDFLELTLASWLFISPFVLGFFYNTVATLSAMFVGSVIILFSLLGMAKHQPLDEWANLLACVALIASPWFMAYTEIAAATVNAVACGVVLGVIAIGTMMNEYKEIRESEGQGLGQH